MNKQLILLTLCIFSFTKGQGISYQDERRVVEAGFDRMEGYNLFSQDYDKARVYFLAVIDTCEKAGYWDICLRSLTDLAHVASKTYIMR